MEEAKGTVKQEPKGIVKHILLVKFRDDISPEGVEELIKSYGKLANLVPPMKSLEWGSNVSTVGKDQGYTHVFESTYDSTEGVQEYIDHPMHVKYSNMYLPSLEKVIVIDYKPTVIKARSEE